MRYFILAFIMLTTISSYAQDCARTATFGTVDICLPIIEGYEECYLLPNVKSLADATEIPANDVLGFYINDEMMQRKDEIGSFNLDDYFKIYATKQLAHLDANKEILNQMREMTASTFSIKHWEDVKQTIDTGLDLGVEVGVPTVIKTYSVDDASFTYVMLIKYDIEGAESFTMAMTMNGLLLNKRLVWMAYYRLYENEETINKLQEQSDKIVKKILAAGK